MVVAILVALALSGCAAATPLCDQAAVLAGRGQLAEATELYARGQQAEEGSCADTGLRTSGAAYAEAFTEASRGARAELAGDPRTAGAAYQNALRIDTANAAARAGLARLDQGAPRMPVTVVTVPTQPPAPWWQTLWPLLLAAFGVIAVCSGAVYLVDDRSRRSAVAAARHVDEAGDRATAARAEYDRTLDELRTESEAQHARIDRLEVRREAHGRERTGDAAPQRTDREPGSPGVDR